MLLGSGTRRRAFRHAWMPRCVALWILAAGVQYEDHARSGDAEEDCDEWKFSGRRGHCTDGFTNPEYSACEMLCPLTVDRACSSRLWRLGLKRPGRSMLKQIPADYDMVSHSSVECACFSRLRRLGLKRPDRSIFKQGPVDFSQMRRGRFGSR